MKGLGFGKSLLFMNMRNGMMGYLDESQSPKAPRPNIPKSQRPNIQKSKHPKVQISKHPHFPNLCDLSPLYKNCTTFKNKT